MDEEYIQKFEVWHFVPASYAQVIAHMNELWWQCPPIENFSMSLPFPSRFFPLHSDCTDFPNMTRASHNFVNQQLSFHPWHAGGSQVG